MIKEIRTAIFAYIAIFIILAPLSFDFYNTLNIRTFLNYFFANSSFVDPSEVSIRYLNYEWKLDWPYPPLTILFLLPSFIANLIYANEFLFQFFYKLPFVISAIIISQLIYKQTKSSNKIIGYLFNPAVVLITVIWGGFDIINSLLIILFFIQLKKQNHFLSSLILSLSISLRLYTIVLLPILFITSKKDKGVFCALKLLVTAFSIPLLSFVFSYFYHDGFLYKALIEQQSKFGPFGFYAIIYSLMYIFNELKLLSIDHNLIVFLSLSSLFLTQIILYYYFYKNKIKLADCLILSLLLFFLFYPKMHALYVISLLPFGFLYQRWKYLKLVVIPGFFYALFINGYMDNRGITYWFSWITNISFSFNPFVNNLLTVILSILYEVIIIFIIYKYLVQNKILKPS